MKKICSFLLPTTFFLFLILIANSASAVSLLIGDVDGFGISPTGLYSAQGDLADTDGDGLIEDGEYLPDWNEDGATAVNSGDDFDFRSTSELNSTDGAQWTDTALLNSAADDALFTFYFDVPEFGDSDYGVDHYINLLFGDYDVTPMYIYVDGEKVTLTAQSSADDGLVQLAYAVVSWEDMLDGEVIIEIYAPNEPYITLDYAYLDTEYGTPDSVPEPSTMLLLFAGLFGLAGAKRKMEK